MNPKIIRLKKGQQQSKNNFLASEHDTNLKHGNLSQIENIPSASDTDKPDSGKWAVNFLRSLDPSAYPSRLPLLRYREEWYLFDGMLFKRISFKELRAKITQTLIRYGQKSKDVQRFLNNVIAWLEGHCLIPSSTTFPVRQTKNGLEPIQNFLFFTNGILNFEKYLNNPETCTLLPLSPQYVSSIGFPHRYDRFARSPLWSSTLQEIFPDRDLRLLMQEIFGYCLIPDLRFQKFFVLQGSGGNGKGVVLFTLTNLVGDENVSNVTLEEFANPHVLVDTLNKLINIVGDLGYLNPLAEGKFKSFVGGDRMNFNPKFQSPFNAIPTAKLLIATNNAISFRDRSNAIRRRLVIIPFLRTFSEALGGIEDPQLVEKLKEEMSGIMNWALRGARRLYQRNRFEIPLVCNELAEQYLVESNPAKRFLEEFCEADPDGVIEKGTLYRCYSHFCEERGFRRLNDTHFGREVFAQFPEVKTARSNTGNRPWTYEGIKTTIILPPDYMFLKQKLEF